MLAEIWAARILGLSESPAIRRDDVRDERATQSESASGAPLIFTRTTASESPRTNNGRSFAASTRWTAACPAERRCARAAVRSASRVGSGYVQRSALSQRGTRPWSAGASERKLGGARHSVSREVTCAGAWPTTEGPRDSRTSRSRRTPAMLSVVPAGPVDWGRKGHGSSPAWGARFPAYRKHGACALQLRQAPLSSGSNPSWGRRHARIR